MYHPDLNFYKTFGIRVFLLTNGIYHQIGEVLDVSVDKVTVDNLANSLNEKQLSPIYLMDVIEDFIG